MFFTTNTDSISEDTPDDSNSMTEEAGLSATSGDYYEDLSMHIAYYTSTKHTIRAYMMFLYNNITTYTTK